MALEKVVNVSLKIHGKGCVDYYHFLKLCNRRKAKGDCQHFIKTCTVC